MPRAERTPTPERQIDWGALIETALTVKGSLGPQYSRFYPYSFMNQCFLLQQGLEPQPVATFKRWQELGRHVLKGSKAKAIVRPIIVPQKKTVGEEAESRVFFKAVNCIFGLSDTEGEELPPAEIPGWDYHRAIETLDIREVPFAMLNGNVQGYAQEREMAINPVAAHPAQTRMHEIAHIVIGHTVQSQLDEYRHHRGIKEFQAEATAHLTMNELGQLPASVASESRGYCQHWLQGEKPPDSAIRQVFVATDTILRAGRGAAEQLTLWEPA
jgi:antirestriction protein ArdC